MVWYTVCIISHNYPSRFYPSLNLLQQGDWPLSGTVEQQQQWTQPPSPSSEFSASDTSLHLASPPPISSSVSAPSLSPHLQPLLLLCSHSLGFSSGGQELDQAPWGGSFHPCSPVEEHSGEQQVLKVNDYAHCKNTEEDAPPTRISSISVPSSV